MAILGSVGLMCVSKSIGLMCASKVLSDAVNICSIKCYYKRVME